jgi:hypothetical protein
MSQGDPTVRRPKLPSADEGPIEHPIGMSMPTTEFPPSEPQLYELHTVESWARAVLMEALDTMSRPPQPPPGQEPEHLPIPFGYGQMDVGFTVVALAPGQVGFAATFSHSALGGRIYYNHHLVKLTVTPSDVPDPTAPTA